MMRTSRDVGLAKVGPRRPRRTWKKRGGLWTGITAARKRVTILFVAANQSADGPLALDKEYRAIEESIRAARHRRAFQLVPKLAARLSDLQQALLEHRPEVIHIACHGSPDAELMLLSNEAGTVPVSPTALASTFDALADNLTLVACNACFTIEQAEAIRATAGVSEWVEDDRDTGGVKTIRGGSWASREAAQVRGAVRKRVPADTAEPEIGFRCASSVIDPDPADEGAP